MSQSKLPLIVSVIALGVSIFSYMQTRKTCAVSQSSVAGVREALMEDPKMLEEAYMKLQTVKNQEKAEHVKKLLGEKKDEIFFEKDAFVIGNKTGDVSLAFFFDYRCPFSRRMAPVVAQLLKEDKDLRIVLKENPIFPGNAPAKAALAAGKQGKYFEYHQALMQTEGKMEEEALLKIAQKLGLNMTQFKQDLASEALDKVVVKNQALAASLELTFSPTIILGEDMLPGAMEPQQLKEHVAKVRGKK